MMAGSTMVRMLHCAVLASFLACPLIADEPRPIENVYKRYTYFGSNRFEFVVTSEDISGMPQWSPQYDMAVPPLSPHKACNVARNWLSDVITNESRFVIYRVSLVSLEFTENDWSYDIGFKNIDGLRDYGDRCRVIVLMSGHVATGAMVAAAQLVDDPTESDRAAEGGGADN